MNESEQVTDTQSNAGNGLHFEHFDQLVNGLKQAVNRFQEDQTPESFAGIISALKGFGISGADIWQRAASYTKQNPVRTAFFAGIAFYAFKGLMAQVRGTNRPALH